MPHQLFRELDSLAEDVGVEKIKTIGDCYMAVAGVPTPRENHKRIATRLALQMVAAAERVSATLPAAFLLRVGVHSGPVMAGVIGSRKFAYDVWGRHRERCGPDGECEPSKQRPCVFDDSKLARRRVLARRPAPDRDQGQARRRRVLPPACRDGQHARAQSRQAPDDVAPDVQPDDLNRAQDAQKHDGELNAPAERLHRAGISVRGLVGRLRAVHQDGRRAGELSAQRHVLGNQVPALVRGLELGEPRREKPCIAQNRVPEALCRAGELARDLGLEVLEPTPRPRITRRARAWSLVTSSAELAAPPRRSSSNAPMASRWIWSSDSSELTAWVNRSRSARLSPACGATATLR